MLVKDIKSREKISFFAKCLCVYFALMLCNIFSIAGLGTILKLYAVFLLVISVRYLPQARVRFDTTFVSQIGYLLICFFSLLYSINLDQSLSTVITLAMNFGLVIICQSIRFSPLEVKMLQRSLYLGGILVLISSLFFADFSTANRLTIQIMGDAADQNFINGYLLFAFSYFVYQAINGRKLKVLNIAIVFLFLLFTFATGSRGSLLALLSVVAILLLIKVLNRKKDILKVLIFVIILLMAFSVILSILPEDVAIRFSQDYIEENGTTSRSEIWTALLTRFFNDDLFSLLFGKGVETAVYYNNYDDHVAHNVFIEVLIGTGFVGLTFYCLIIFSIFKKAWLSKNYIEFAAFFGYMIMCMSLSLTSYKPIFNAIMIIEISYRSFVRSNTNISEIKTEDHLTLQNNVYE